MISALEIKEVAVSNYNTYVEKEDREKMGELSLDPHEMGYESYVTKNAARPTRTWGSERFREAMGLTTDTPSLEEIERLSHRLRASDGVQLASLKGTTKEKRVAYTDYVCTAPKSFSVEIALLRSSPNPEDHEVAEEIETLLTQSFIKAFQDVSNVVGLGRKRVPEYDKPISMHVEIGGFENTHRVARPTADALEDPHWHSHLRLLNLGILDDGSISSVHNWEIRDHWLPVINAGAQAYIKEGMEGLGYRTEAVRYSEGKKAFRQVDLVKRDDAVNLIFSSRHEDIKRATKLQFQENKSKRLGELQQAAALKGLEEPRELTESQITRCQPTTKQIEVLKQSGKKAKTDITPEKLTVVWEQRLREAGAKSTWEGGNVKTESNYEKSLETIKKQVLWGDALTTHSSYFDRTDIYYYCYQEALKHNFSAEQRDRLVAEIEAELKTLPEEVPSTNGAYTTPHMIIREEYIEAKLQELRTAPGKGVDKDTVDEKVLDFDNNHDYSMSEEQKQAVEFLTRPERLAILSGEAGTGKSTTLSVLRAAYEAEGYNVIGLATSSAAEQVLKDSGYNSWTIALFNTSLRTMGHISKKDGARVDINNKSVLVIDESSMTSSQEYYQLLKTLDERKIAKIILTGHVHQLHAVSSGSMFTRIVTNCRDKVTVLSENFRQKSDHEAYCTDLLLQGQALEYLIEKQNEGLLLWGDDDEDTIHKAAQIWLDAVAQRYNGDRTQIVLMTDTNEQRRIANEYIEAAEKANGTLQGEGLYTGSQTYYVGSRVQAIKILTEKRDALDAQGNKTWYDPYHAKTTKYRLSRTGQLGEVVGIEGEKIKVRLDSAKPDELLTLTPEQAEIYFQATVATTKHKVQGKSVLETVEPKTLNSLQNINSAYVSQSRNMQRNTVVVSRDIHEEEKHSDMEILQAHAKQMDRSGHKKTTLDFYKPIGGAEVPRGLSEKSKKYMADKEARDAKRWKAKQLSIEEVISTKQRAKEEVAAEKRSRTHGMPIQRKTPGVNRKVETKREPIEQQRVRERDLEQGELVK